MALKIISFIFVISLAFGIQNPTQFKDVPFNANEVINRVSLRHSQKPNPKSLIPNLTGEFLIDTSIVYISTPNDQGYSSIAFDGTNYLVVWADRRSWYWDIYGTRVNQSGVILDSNGIRISTAINDQQSPSVAFDGTNYLVVWRDQRSGSYADIRGARVTPSGIVLDSNGITISTAPYSHYTPSVAFNGANYLVVWTGARSGDTSDIYGSRVNQTGVVLDTNGIAISTAVRQQYSPFVVSDGADYLVVWQDERNSFYPDIYGARINQAGVVLDPNGIVISTATDWQWNPSAAFDGTNYLVVWSDQRNEYVDIYGARVTPAGLVLDPNGIAISTAPYSQHSPSVAFGWN
jgi:hypothetical protein